MTTQQQRDFRISVNCLIESSRCLGVSQVAGDGDAVSHYNALIQYYKGQLQAAQQVQRGSSVCPYPCGWKKLHTLIVKDAAFFARSTIEDDFPEAIRDAGIRLGQQSIELCRAAMKAQPAQQVPDGWKLVPIDPTPEMLSAGREKIQVWQWKEKGRLMKEMRFKPAVWAAMLDNAPTPTQEQ